MANSNSSIAPVPGRIFHNLTVITQIPQPAGNKRGRVFLCRCKCGNEKEYSYGVLNSGNVKSCGCDLKSYRTSIRKADAKTRHPHYRLWQTLLNRCCRPKHQSYRLYGLQGVKICDEWRDDFLKFVADLPEKPEQASTLRLIDQTGNYEPGNVEWRTANNAHKQQRIKRPIRMYYIRTDTGQDIRLHEACKSFRIPYRTAYSRLVASRKPVRGTFPVSGKVICKTPPVTHGEGEKEITL